MRKAYILPRRLLYMQVAEASDEGKASGATSSAERSDEYAVVRFPFQFSLLAVSQLLKHTADELPAFLIYRWEQQMFYDGRLPYREQRTSSFIGNLERCTLMIADTTLMFCVKQAESEGKMPSWGSIEFDISDASYPRGISDSQRNLLERTKSIMHAYLKQSYDELKYVSTRVIER